MSKYEIFIPASVAKDLEKLDRAVRKRITEKIRTLADNPRPAGYIKLQGRDEYRIRTGDYRIIYKIEDEKLFIIIIKVGNRKNVYD